MTRRPFAAPGLDGARAAKRRVLFLTGTRADFGKHTQCSNVGRKLPQVIAQQ